jgi:CBS domain-containing protein
MEKHRGRARAAQGRGYLPCDVPRLPDARLAEALERMENRPSQISVLPVVEAASNRCLGLVRLHDLYRTEAG